MTGWGRGWLIAGAVVAALPVSGAAQVSEGPSIFSLLPVAGPVRMGAEGMPGELVDSDYLAGGQRVRAFGFDGEEGAPVTIDVMSEAFDAYVYLLGPDGREVASDDDSGGACNARIETFLETGGSYRIVVGSFSGNTGPFTLRVDNRRHPAATGDCGEDFYGVEMMGELLALEPRGTLGVGEETSGALSAEDGRISDGSYAEAWWVSGEPGTTAVIDLVSRAFDALLFVIGPDESDYDSDDDSGGACNSRLTITFGEGPHRAVVNSLSADGSGPFTLKVSATAGPEDTGPCPSPPADIIR